MAEQTCAIDGKKFDTSWIGVKYCPNCHIWYCHNCGYQKTTCSKCGKPLK